jgi:hypothetical protein
MAIESKKMTEDTMKNRLNLDGEVINLDSIQAVTDFPNDGAVEVMFGAGYVRTYRRDSFNGLTLLRHFDLVDRGEADRLERRMVALRNTERRLGYQRMVDTGQIAPGDQYEPVEEEYQAPS